MITDADRDRLDDYSDAMADLLGQQHRLDTNPFSWLQDFAQLLAEGDQLLEHLRDRAGPPDNPEPPGGDPPP